MTCLRTGKRNIGSPNKCILYLAQTERERVPIMEAFQTTSAKRGLFIGLGVMLLQQFTGCNAVIFYATFIFKVKFGRKN